MRKVIDRLGTTGVVVLLLVLTGAAVGIAALVLRANIQQTASVADYQVTFITDTVATGTGQAGSQSLETVTAGVGTCTATVRDGRGGDLEVDWSGVWTGSTCETGLTGSGASVPGSYLILKNPGTATVYYDGLDFGLSTEFGPPLGGAPIVVELADYATGNPIADGTPIIAGKGLNVKVMYYIDQAVANPGDTYGPATIGVLARTTP